MMGQKYPEKGEGGQALLPERFSAGAHCAFDISIFAVK